MQLKDLKSKARHLRKGKKVTYVAELLTERIGAKLLVIVQFHFAPQINQLSFERTRQCWKQCFHLHLPFQIGLHHGGAFLHLRRLRGLSRKVLGRGGGGDHERGGPSGATAQLLEHALRLLAGRCQAGRLRSMIGAAFEVKAECDVAPEIVDKLQVEENEEGKAQEVEDMDERQVYSSLFIIRHSRDSEKKMGSPIRRVMRRQFTFKRNGT